MNRTTLLAFAGAGLLALPWLSRGLLAPVHRRHRAFVCAFIAYAWLKLGSTLPLVLPARWPAAPRVVGLAQELQVIRPCAQPDVAAVIDVEAVRDR